MEERLRAILRALKITEIEYSLSGGGDSGEATLERVTFADNSTTSELPDIPVLFANTGQIGRLPELLENIVVEAPEGDWVNNEGGHGNVFVRPFEDDDGLFIECDMIYGDEDDDEEDFDDEEFLDEPDDNDDREAIPLVVNDGEVAP
ncbi:hypothetical protein [Afipia sp. P52-10]|uniref:hypothetical protein n=1 Tax=Afipia sp. P52-10 TaxID=1429916 RepID=UPI00054F892E|nr:hypothetical protein [Afipia sp. P52-10]